MIARESPQESLMPDEPKSKTEDKSLASDSYTAFNRFAQSGEFQFRYGLNAPITNTYEKSSAVITKNNQTMCAPGYMLEKGKCVPNNTEFSHGTRTAKDVERTGFNAYENRKYLQELLEASLPSEKTYNKASQIAFISILVILSLLPPLQLILNYRKGNNAQSPMGKIKV